MEDCQSPSALWDRWVAVFIYGFTLHSSTGSAQTSYAAGDYIVLEANGTGTNNLEVYTSLSGGAETSRITFSDATISSGYPGIQGWRNNTEDVCQVTSWEGGDDVPPGQKTRPNADVTDGGWYSNTGTQTDLYSFINETSASDADFIESAISTTGQWTMTPITSVGTGTYVLRYRAAGDASSNLIAHIGVGTAAGTFSAVQSFTEVGVPTAVTAFAHTVTGTFSDTTKLSVKFEAT